MREIKRQKIPRKRGIDRERWRDREERLTDRGQVHGENGG